MVVFLTGDALFYKLVVNANSNNLAQLACHLPMFVTACLWAFFTRYELKQFTRPKAKMTFWNALHVTSLFFIFAAYALRALELASVGVLQGNGDTSFYWSTTVLAITLPVTYLNTLYYLQGFDKRGKLVCMIIRIVKGAKR